MSASIVDFPHDLTRPSACEALADDIVAGIPALAEARGLPAGRVALAVWLALFCDLADTEGGGARMGDLFELARHSAHLSLEERA